MRRRQVFAQLAQQSKAMTPVAAQNEYAVPQTAPVVLPDVGASEPAAITDRSSPPAAAKREKLRLKRG